MTIDQWSSDKIIHLLVVFNLLTNISRNHGQIHRLWHHDLHSLNVSRLPSPSNEALFNISANDQKKQNQSSTKLLAQ